MCQRVFVNSCMDRIENHGTYCGLDTWLAVDSHLGTGMVVAFVDKLQIKMKIILINHLLN